MRIVLSEKIHNYEIEKGRKILVEDLSPNDILGATTNQSINLVKKTTFNTIEFVFFNPNLYNQKRKKKARETFIPDR